jgi:hypothetical protein
MDICRLPFAFKPLFQIFIHARAADVRKPLLLGLRFVFACLHLRNALVDGVGEVSKGAKEIAGCAGLEQVADGDSLVMGQRRHDRIAEAGSEIGFGLGFISHLSPTLQSRSWRGAGRYRACLSAVIASVLVG